MKNTITWLHLSDLHVSSRSGWDSRRVTTTLLADLKRLRDEHDLRPDLIFFTGDAAFGQIGKGKGERIRDQLEVAHKFLTDVRGVFDLELRDVYLVPGNHDINRDETDPGQASWLADKDRSLAEVTAMIQGGTKQWRRYLERLEDYRIFLKERGYGHLLTDPKGRLIYADSREIGGLRVGIVGFNSAWSCCREDKKGHLWVGGRYQLEELQGELSAGAVAFTIALIHHPGSWFVEQEDPNVQRLLESEFQFVLHGHEHQDWVKCDAPTGHTTLSAGACYDRSEGQNGYSVVRLDREAGTGEVWLRQFDSSGGGWVPRDVSKRTHGGRWPLEHLGPWFDPLRPTLPGEDTDAEERSSTRKVAREFSSSETATAEYEERFRRAMAKKHDYLELFGADLTRAESKQYSLSVAYVSLNLSDEDDCDEKDVDEEELDFAERSEDGAGLDFQGSLPVEDVFNRLCPDSGRLLVRGAAGCGKSTLLRWVTIEAAKQKAEECEGDTGWRSKVPFLIRLRDCPEGSLPRPKDFPALLAKALPDPTPNWIDEVLTSGRGLVMFDGVDEVPAKYRLRVQREIGEIVDAYPECYYVVSTRPAAVERRWLTSLGFFEARVEPMSAPDREVFIDRWHEAVADQLRERREHIEDLGQLASVLKNKLQDSPQIARLAIYPLLCAMICALHRERNEQLPETQVQLCEDLCHMLLDRRERETPGLSMDHLPPAYQRLNYSHKKYVVAELARFLLVDLEGASSLTEEEAETHIAEAVASFPAHQGSDPVEIRRGLIERSGLLRPAEAGRIDFLHNTLKEYLAAERFVAERAYGLLAQHAEDDAWQPVILFAVAFPDPDFASCLLKELLPKTPDKRQKSQTKKRPTKKAQKEAVARERARQFFLLRIRNTAFRVEAALVERLDEIARAVLPPRTPEPETPAGWILADVGHHIRVAERETLLTRARAYFGRIVRLTDCRQVPRDVRIRLRGDVQGFRADFLLHLLVEVLDQVLIDPEVRIFVQPTSMGPGYVEEPVDTVEGEDRSPRRDIGGVRHWGKHGVKKLARARETGSCKFFRDPTSLLQICASTGWRRVYGNLESFEYLRAKPCLLDDSHQPGHAVGFALRVIRPTRHTGFDNGPFQPAGPVLADVLQCTTVSRPQRRREGLVT